MERKLQGLKIIADAVAASLASVTLTTIASVSQGSASALSPQVTRVVSSTRPHRGGYDNSIFSIDIFFKLDV